jgi:iron complex outermembrane receptor protein
MRHYLITVLLLTAISTFAQDTTKTLSPVKVYGIRSYTGDPITKTNISKKDLEDNNFSYEPAVILSNTPSIIMYSDGGNNNGYMYYRIRGVDQTRINATLNGIPLNEPEDQGAYFSNYPDFLSNVSSIQIQRGIGISSTGTSSFGGSLNFEGPDLKTKSTLIESMVGSWGTYRLSVANTTGYKKGFSQYVRFSTLGSNGYRDHSGTRGNTLFYSAGYEKNKHSFLLTSFFGRSKNEMAYLASDEDVLANDRRNNPLTADEKDNFYQNLNSLQYTYKESKALTFSASVFYNRLRGDYDVLLAPDMYNFRLSSNFYGVISSVNFNVGNLKLNVGANVNVYDRTHSAVIKPNTSTDLYKNTGYKNDVMTWTKGSYALGKVTLFTDLQFRSAGFDYKREGVSVDPITWDFVNYRFGVNYKACAKVNLYVMYGSSMREPTRNDMFAGFDDLDNSNVSFIGDFGRVKPEQVKNLEAGAVYASENLTLKGNIFSMDFTNEIAAVGKLSYIGLPLRKNVASSYRRGVEVEFSYKPLKNVEVTGYGTYMISRIKEYTNDETGKTYKNVESLNTPRHNYNVGVSYEYKKAKVGASAHHTSNMWMNNENTAICTGGTMVSLFLKYRVFRLTVNNLTNIDNFASGYVSGGKNYFYVSPKLNYQFAVSFKL